MRYPRLPLSSCPTIVSAIAACLVLANPAVAVPWKSPPEPPVRPQLPQRFNLDADENRIDDEIDALIQLRHAAVECQTNAGDCPESDPVAVELVFSSQITDEQIQAFVNLGGEIQHVYRAVSYGWNGRISTTAVEAVPAALGESLVIITQKHPGVAHMDEATRTGRVRSNWAAGFGGTANGLSGTSDITVAILDSGVDETHTDLAGRQEYWKDWTSDNASTPGDVYQHGTHAAGIAVGSGAAFGVGPNTLAYTDSGDLTGKAINTFDRSLVHLPPALVTFTQVASWIGGGSAMHRLAARTNGVSGGFISLNQNSSSSPSTLTTNTNGNTSQVYSTALQQNGSITRYAVANSISNYPAVGDGFAAMRGVAPNARWAGLKTVTDAGTTNSTDISEALDDLIVQRSVHNIKVANLSSGLTALDSTLRDKINTVVDNGIVVVVSAGNTGPSGTIQDPARASLVITVGAANDSNQLTEYTSQGFASPGTNEDTKPDLLAPGGSDYWSGILSTDSNDSDAGLSSFADRTADDYLNIRGTSVAAPFVAGAAALVIDAMQQAGTTWTFSSSAQPLFVKMLLCASATETNQNREQGLQNPTLGRAATPKDIFEGYGMMNPDAAAEAIGQSYSGGTLSDATAGGRFDRRAWGRKLGITSGDPVTLILDVPPTADYDLYLYSGNPDSAGNPVIVASSANAGADLDESITFTPTMTETRYLFIKRVSGNGSWSLSQVFCGDGSIQGSEECDDGNTAEGDCCGSSCEIEADGSACSDGQFCTAIDQCSSGVCTGSADPCFGGAECANTCNEATDSCFVASGVPCSSDSNPCTIDQCNGAGTCAHPAGNAGAICRVSSGVCDLSETCTGISSTCPADGKANSTCRPAAGICDTTETCDGTNNACPADAKSTAVCRAGAGVCDLTELCDGASNSCPADAKSSALCRVAAGVCDAEESCDGSNNTCPADAFLAPAVVCRGTQGVCDTTDVCAGTSADCPVDAKRTSICRASVSVCDAADSCNGTSNDCPADAFLAALTVCREAVDVCDSAERCTGDSSVCPADDFQSAITICRAAEGVCDTPEVCTGSETACPPDEKNTATCRASSGTCDVAEVCDGVFNECPTDTLQPSSAVCRPTAGVCDSPEFCTGNATSCPTDSKRMSVCRPAISDCDAEESCSGSSDTCPVDAVEEAGTSCGNSSSSACDSADTCDGAGACQTNHAADGTSCNDGLFCDGADQCSAGACALHAGNPCEGPDGDADCVESCDESSDSCLGSDPDGSSCSTAQACVIDETCTGGICGGGNADPTCCDDGNPCTQDSYNPDSNECENAVAPAELCLVAGKSGLGLSTRRDGKMRWKLGGGEATRCEDLGSPDSDTEYDLCVYDGVGSGAYALASHFHLSSSSNWIEGTGCRWTYDDDSASSDGITGLRLTPGEDGRSAVQFAAAGLSAPIPAPVSAEKFLTFDPDVVVQLHNSLGVCWESEFVTAKKNTGEKLKTNRLILFGQ